MAFEAVVGLRDRRCVERVRGHDVGPNFEKGVVDARDDSGLGQAQDVGVALQIEFMLREPLATEVGFV